MCPLNPHPPHPTRETDLCGPARVSCESRARDVTCLPTQAPLRTELPGGHYDGSLRSLLVQGGASTTTLCPVPSADLDVARDAEFYTDRSDVQLHLETTARMLQVKIGDDKLREHRVSQVKVQAELHEHELCGNRLHVRKPRVNSDCLVESHDKLSNKKINKSLHRSAIEDCIDQERATNKQIANRERSTSKIRVKNVSTVRNVRASDVSTRGLPHTPRRIDSSVTRGATRSIRARDASTIRNAYSTRLNDAAPRSLSTYSRGAAPRNLSHSSNPVTRNVTRSRTNDPYVRNVRARSDPAPARTSSMRAARSETRAHVNRERSGSLRRSESRSNLLAQRGARQRRYSKSPCSRKPAPPPLSLPSRPS